MTKESIRPGKIIKTIVNPILNQLADQSGKVYLSHRTFPKHSIRKDLISSDPIIIAEGLKQDAKRDREFLGIDTLFEEDCAKGAVTVAASAHTPIMFEGLGGKEIPAHLVAWWWEKGGQRKNILDLTEVPLEELGSYLNIITKGITDSFNFFHSRRPESEIDIYGLIGHTSPEERKATGLGKGTQTNMHGHTNIVWHDSYNGATEKQASLDEVLKMIGPMDVVIMEKWGDAFVKLIEKALSNNGNIDKVGLEKRHRVNSDDKTISFFDNLTIDFRNPTEIREAFRTMIPIIALFKKVYANVFSTYEGWFLSSHEKRQQIVSDYFSESDRLGMDREIARSMLEFSLKFFPTYGQVDLWTKRTDLDEATFIELNRLKKRYEKLRTGGHFSLNADINHLERFLTAQMLGLTKKGQLSEFVWPSVLSMIYKFNKPTTGNNQVYVNRISLSPRFFSNKGMVEHITGGIVDRPLPQ